MWGRRPRLTHRREPLFRFVDSGGMALVFTSCCYFLILHFYHLLFFFFHLHFVKAKNKKSAVVENKD